MSKALKGQSLNTWQIVLIEIYNMKPEHRYLSKVQLRTGLSQSHTSSVLKYLCAHGYLVKKPESCKTPYEVTVLAEKAALGLMQLRQYLPKMPAEYA